MVVVSENQRVCCELIEEGLESPLTDSVASFLITIGWFVNIVPLWFNLLCAVRRKLFPEGCWRGLLIYLLCINSVLAGERTRPSLHQSKQGNVDLCWPKTLRWTPLNDELGRQRACLSFLWFTLPHSPVLTDIYPGIHGELPTCVSP